MIFLDSNIVIDLAVASERFSAWSARQIAIASVDHDLVIDQIVLAEICYRFPDLAATQAWLAGLGIGFRNLGSDAAFRAGTAFKDYRDAGGLRTTLLADFLIAAHAETLGATLMTRDLRRFPRYFPSLVMITPETHP